MAEGLAKSGIYLDELNKIRVLEPEVSQHTSELKEKSKEFVEEIAEFQNITDDFITMVDKLAKEVEKEKMKAIGAQNLLKSVAKQREAEQQQLQALILEKSTELERLRVQYHSLQNTARTLQDIIETLVLDQ